MLDESDWKSRESSTQVYWLVGTDNSYILQVKKHRDIRQVKHKTHQSLWIHWRTTELSSKSHKNQFLLLREILNTGTQSNLQITNSRYFSLYKTSDWLSKSRFQRRSEPCLGKNPRMSLNFTCIKKRGKHRLHDLVGNDCRHTRTFLPRNTMKPGHIQEYHAADQTLKDLTKMP